MEKKRFSREFAFKEYEKVKEYMESMGYIVYPSGSLRREKKDVGDIDFLAVGDKKKALEVIENYSEIEKRISKYEFLLKSGIGIHIIPEILEKAIFTLWQSTGSKPHIKKIKELYKEKEIKISEKIKEEREIYTKINLEYIEPQNRYLLQGD